MVQELGTEGEGRMYTVCAGSHLRCRGDDKSLQLLRSSDSLRANCQLQWDANS